MILFEIAGSEQLPAYTDLEISNGSRLYDFLQSIVTAALAIDRPFLSSTLLKALNFHAIACLHTNAGEYRPCTVFVGNHNPPEPYRVDALMDDFLNQVNRNWDKFDPVVLATYVLWRLNYIHPFINGNGRTARAACYFVLCVSNGGLIRGAPILPELISRERNNYVQALQEVDSSSKNGKLDLAPLHSLIARLLLEQISSATPAPVQNPASAPPNK